MFKRQATDWLNEQLNNCIYFINITDHTNDELKKVITKSMKYIVDSLKYSDFEVLGHELEFKQGGQYEAIIYELKI